MTKPIISNELLNAYFDHELEGPLKQAVETELSKNTELLAQYIELQTLRNQAQSIRQVISWDSAAQESLIPSLKRQKHTDATPWRKVFSVAASITLAVTLGFLLGKSDVNPQNTPIESTWIYRATGAHQIAFLDDAWSRANELSEVPTQYSVLVTKFLGEEALHQLGYELAGWRVAGDGHSPVALQLVYRTKDGGVVTAFIRDHVEESEQISKYVVINGVPTYFTGKDDVDTALVSKDLPFENIEWINSIT